jgi:hypothetical protein
MVSSGDPVGVIVVRVWREPAHPVALRARVTAVADVAGRGEQEEVVVSTVDEIVDAVRRFVAPFAEA